MRKLALLSTSLFGVMATMMLSAASCESTPPDVYVPPSETKSCDEHTDCAAGEICAGGSCRPGECVLELQDQCGAEAPDDVAPYCCKPWETCNALNACVPNPDSPLGNQCLVSDDCAGVGQFCSGGTCYDTAGRDACTASHQCPAGERCDRTVFLCVPDRGGCTYANEYPELACEDGLLCDTETGFCIDPGDVECTDESDCRDGQLCDDLGRCVQCVSNDDCGPGTECNTGTGNCVSTVNRCETDDDCSSGRRCSPATNECIVPQCEEDRDCEDDDERKRCDLTSFTCYLPPATCDESDEPNDSTGEATEIGLTGYAGTLCRGNTDFLAFPVQANKRYRATVSFPDFNVTGVTVSMLNTSGFITDQTVIGYDDEALVTGISAVDESGFFMLRIFGGSEDADVWSYTVSIEETEAPQQIDCAEEPAQGIEPNDSFATAYAIEPGQPITFARCGDSDVDFYKVSIPPLHGVEVTVEHNRQEGDLELFLYDGASESDRVDSSTSSQEVERVEAPEGATEFWFKVELWENDFDADPNQSYTVTARAVPRPPACDTDINEPDGTLETAGDLPLDTQVQAIRCNPTDADYFSITVPANTGGTVRLDFTHSDGDLRLDLLAPDGTSITSSNRSRSSEGAMAFEVVDLPFAAAEQTYIARVRLHSGSGVTAQPYGIQVSTYDASACTLSEPTPNDTLSTGQCVGTFPTEVACVGPSLPSPVLPEGLAACAAATEAIPGCGTICGSSDEDWYRVGALNDAQLLRARLEHDPQQGVLGLALVRLNPDAAEPVTNVITNFNTDGDAVLELALVAPTVDPAFAREHAVKVWPVGPGSFNAQPYALEIEVGAPCLADSNEPNQIDDTATLIRPAASPLVPYNEAFSGTLCGSDIDVFSLYAFQDETITATLEGVPGMTVFIGGRAVDDNEVPLPLPCGEGVVEGEPAPACTGGDAGVPDAGASAGAGGSVDGGSVDGGSVDGGAIAGDAGSADAGGGGGPYRVIASVRSDLTQPVYIVVKRDDPYAIGGYTLRVQAEAP